MGKQLVFDTLAHKATGAVPWVPFAGVHAGKLKGYNAKEVLTDGDKLFEALMEVNKLYVPDGMTTLFDLQVEAEILGCELMWADYNPPSVKTHPLEQDRTIPGKDAIPDENSGRIPMILDTMRRIKAAIGDDVALYGLICGPFTLASHLRGTNIFMDMMKDADYVSELIGFCGEVACKMADMYLEAGMDVIAAVDPLVSQISPAHSRKMLAPTYTALFDHIRKKGAYSCFFVCGDATRQIEEMCKMNPDGISVDENVNLATAKEITDRYNISLGGNIPLTTTMLFGTQQDNMKCVIDLMDSVDHKNLVISPGCDMPYDVPIENTIAAAQAVKSPDSVREMLKNYSGGTFDDIEIEIPDYANRDKVLIELFTLDPEQCAACTYMVNIVEDNYDAVKDIADYVVYKYTIKEDIARTAKMGVKNLPTMCINGEQKWVSLIPSAEELISEVRKYAKK
ncbi:uroporphyrinogen decarboxylase family protein [Ruminococcaceae bacterium OttesenSCG-928-A11]|nr:uroporphyrinogen decarboxylase family protein [Ruminococcaceae bacterium OttesenSCG-928-A11]